jgi:hypothetical protein
MKAVRVFGTRMNNLTVSEAYSWNYSASLALQLVGLALALGAVVWF